MINEYENERAKEFLENLGHGKNIYQIEAEERDQEAQ